MVPAETPTPPTVASPPTKAEVQPQAQPVAQQQTTPPSVVGTASQQAAQTPSSPAPPQRPARRKQPGPAQQPAAQPSPSKASSGQPLAPLQQITQPSLADSQKDAEMVSFPLVSANIRAGQNFNIPFKQTPPASPKTTKGHQNQVSEAVASDVARNAVSDGSNQPQDPNGSAALEQ